MDYACTYEHMIGQFCVASYEVKALIVGNAKDWHVETIKIDGSRFNGLTFKVEYSEVEVPKTDPMFATLKAYLDVDCADDIATDLCETGRAGYNDGVGEGHLQHEIM